MNYQIVVAARDCRRLTRVQNPRVAILQFGIHVTASLRIHAPAHGREGEARRRRSYSLIPILQRGL